MFSNQLAVAALAGTCVAAAAGGGYLAARHSAAPAAPAQERQAAAGAQRDLASTPAEEPTAAPAAGAAPAARPSSQPANQPPKGVARTATSSRASGSRAAARPSAAARSATAAPETRSVPADAAVRADTAHVQPPAVPPPAFPVLVPTQASSDISNEWQDAPEEPDSREIVVRADSVVGLELESAVSSETAVVEDRVEARVSRDVRVDGEVAVPAGSRALGTVVEVERGGRFREQARLGIRFDTLVLPDGTRLPVSTETIYRLGSAPGRATAAKIGGGAVAGAILGGLLGGSKGAAIGASSGAGAGTAVVYAGDRSEATFPQGAEITARILADVPVTLARHPATR